MHIQIRPERPEDGPGIFLVNEQAFGRPDEAILVDVLRKGAAFIPGLSLVAEVGGSLVGHILFSRISIVQEDGLEQPSLALAPMAVLPEWQGKGIGSALVREGLRLAAEAGHLSVVVLGHQHYYPRFGFEPASRWHIRPPFDVPDAAFMVLALQPGALEGVAGTVQYPPAFDEV
jgi:putative acetyltransferase